ncbi:ribosome maturation factor RimM [Cellulosilyticum sp. I15G10I2]|uniref:ribosome maturation factor RimM n=1 Tax=Cellulosilyticum sp. I15G10I2 TaxID=1892843 RepID=UPI001FA779D7|nr:ribosome maturation factor RimM [Cellulosilyticum sp. I15G10I2]
MFTVGKIVNTHGIKGELKIIPTTDDPKRFEKLKEVYIERKEMHPYKIESIRYHKNFVLMKFEGVNSLNDAELFKNASLKINREDSLPLKNDEYYISDLYDLKVITQEGRLLGRLIDIIYTGSNDVYVVKNEETEKELLIPAIKQVIKQVDLTERTMHVELLEGLEEL